jgi:hypothetical protein
MPELRLLSLEVKHFKGLKGFEFSANGGPVTIYGENATGKTTLKDGFHWLLFGKDSEGRADFEIKTIDQKTGEPLHDLHHEVEGTLALDGKELTLRKSYYEKWTKKRGSAEKSFSGHTTDCYIDGVPVKKQEYAAKVAEIAGDTTVFQLLTDPSYFNEQLHWQERRKILLEVCGDISDADVIKTDEKLTSLQETLSSRSLEDHRKVLKAKQKKINEELETLPVRIDEVSQGLPDIAGLDPEKVQEEIAKLKAQNKGKQDELSRLENGGQVAEKQKELRVVEASMLSLENEHAREQQKRIGEIQERLHAKNMELRDGFEEIRSCKERIERNKKSIAEYEKSIEALREEWKGVDARVFEYEESDTCPTCGQKLPAEQVEEARAKAEGAFNQDKAERLERITEQGKAEKEIAEKLKEDSTALEVEIDKTEQSVARLQADASALQEELDTLEALRSDASTLEAYQDLWEQKATLEGQLKDLRSDTSTAVTHARGQQEKIEEEIRRHEALLSQIDQREKGQARIDELKAQEKRLAEEYEKLEKELFLLEEFTKTKVTLLEEKINSRFQLARFKLFNQLVNGGIEECCETLFNSIPYSTALNSAAKINVGLDVIKTLSGHYGFQAPIFIDGAEGVTHFIDMDGQQVIRLYVSEKDKKLRVEQGEEVAP